MQNLGKLLVLAVAVACATATMAATTTIEVVDRFGDPITDTDIVAIVDGQKMHLGRSTTGMFEIDVDSGSTIIVLPATAGVYDKVELALNGDTTITLPPASRLTCDPATNSPVGVNTVNAFDLVGAGTSPGINETCGFAPIDDLNDTLWFSVIGTGDEMFASTCNDANFDTMIGVYCNGCAQQTCVDTNDDFAGCGLTSTVIWASEAGAEYLIAVQGFFGGTGQGNLSVGQTGAPNAGPPVDCIFEASGACCLPDSCSIDTEANCDATGGTYLGDDTVCETTVAGNEYASTPGTPIPDAGGGAISDTIDVPDDFVIADLNVDFITDHTWVGDLTITVQSPAATVVTLSIGGFGAGNVCEGEVGADLIFDDQGGTNFDDANPPCTGTGTGPVTGDGPGPAGGLLSDFNGENAAGPWVITVQDENTADTGSLLQWSLHFGDVISNCQGACCTDAPGVASDCIEVTQDECAAGNGLFVGGSCDLIDDCLPLFVEFDSVTATKTRAGVSLEWVTTTEIDTVGFRVLREDGREKGRVAVGGLIFAQGFGLQGASYSIVDPEGSDGSRYYLVDVDNTGRETTHGPFLVDRVTGPRESRGERVAR